MKVKRYSPEFKEAIVRKMMPPENVPIMRLAEESGVSYVTLANGGKKCEAEAKPLPETESSPTAGAPRTSS